MTEPLSVWPVTGLPEVAAGDDLAQLLSDGLAASGLALRDGDVLVVSSKVVAKALGLSRPAGSRDAAVMEETVRVVASRRTSVGDTVIGEGRAGPVMAAAGVDASNLSPGSVLLLPADPDAAARTLRARLAPLAHDVVFGLVISDTAGRPWRDGVTDFALGAAGVRVLEDLRGHPDSHGVPLQVTVRAVADELAAAADLVKGKTSGAPAAVVSGASAYVTPDDGPGSASQLRPPDQDWFRLGHVEAVRAALRAGEDGPGTLEPPPAVTPEGVAVRARRALALALAATASTVTGVVTEGVEGVVVELSGSPYALGMAVARLPVALWSEHLATSVSRHVPDRFGGAVGLGEDGALPARFPVRELVD